MMALACINNRLISNSMESKSKSQQLTNSTKANRKIKESGIKNILQDQMTEKKSKEVLMKLWALELVHQGIDMINKNEVM